MSARATQRPRQYGTGGTDYAWECLSRLARILVLCGHSPQELVTTLRHICRTLEVPRRRWDPKQLGFLSDLPHVIALWHSDPSYLAARGEPAALQVRGRHRSLSALIERVMPGEDPALVLEALLSVGGIRKVGHRYVPTDRHLHLRADSGRVHGANALLRMLRTVERNLSAAVGPQIFERAAMNPRFPVAKLAAFHRDLSIRASRFLVAVDGTMRRHELRTSGGRRKRIGVEVFVFEEPAARDRRRRNAARARRRTRTTTASRRKRRGSGKS